ncbi:hypothetical protein A6S26_33585 [Nostoc sp. ATCC 43529]|nr:hypothetical protein A6S26_33585 [Nostoc sp. ATCC 43529]
MFIRKLNRTSRLLCLAINSLLFVGSTLDIAFAGASDYSSYQNSCTNIDVAGALLKATCLTKNSTYKTTGILIRGISNNNGVLTYTSDAAANSSYQSSCKYISVAGNSLTATCLTTNLTYKTTSILIRGIYNNDGVLSYL